MCWVLVPVHKYHHLCCMMYSKYALSIATLEYNFIAFWSHSQFEGHCSASIGQGRYKQNSHKLYRASQAQQTMSGRPISRSDTTEHTCVFVRSSSNSTIFDNVSLEIERDRRSSAGSAVMIESTRSAGLPRQHNRSSKLSAGVKQLGADLRRAATSRSCVGLGLAVRRPARAKKCCCALKLALTKQDRRSKDVTT